MSFKLYIFLVTVLAVVSGLAFSVGPDFPNGSNDDKQEVLRVVERFFNSLVKINEDELKKILSGELTVGTTGKNEIRRRE